MPPRVQGSVLGVALLMVAVGSAQAATEPNDPTTDPRFVLEQIEKRLAAISNYQCTEIHNGKKKHLAYNDQGHGRIRITDDNLDATSLIWDGTRTIEVRERVRPNGTVVHSASIIPDKHPEVGRGNVPRVYLGGLLSDMLARGLENGADISIEPTEEGRCRVVIVHEFGGITAMMVDPQRGYLPIQLRRDEEIDLQEIAPGIWFPTAVWTKYKYEQTARLKQSDPRLRYTDIRINDPDFDRLLAPDLPDGATVADEVRGVRYVVDHARGLTLTNRATTPTSASSAGAPDSEDNYNLDVNLALKRIVPVSPVARNRFIDDSDTDPEQVAGAAFYNTIYVFQWNDAGRPTVSYTGNGFLELSEILLHICGLGIGEFSGAEDLLELRLTGDWIVRRDAPVTERIRALEHIVREETGLNVTFRARRVEASVTRATGIFRYQPLPGARGENDVQLFAERSIDERGTRTGCGHGTLAQLLRHTTNRTGRRFVDDTLSSDMSVSWSDYRSSELDPIRLPGTTYRYDLAQLLEHVARQTGLKFVSERRTIDEWYVTVGP